MSGYTIIDIDGTEYIYNPLTNKETIAPIKVSKNVIRRFNKCIRQFIDAWNKTKLVIEFIRKNANISNEESDTLMHRVTKLYFNEYTFSVGYYSEDAILRRSKQGYKHKKLMKLRTTIQTL
jgi:predicted solute-binding protein